MSVHDEKCPDLEKFYRQARSLLMLLKKKTKRPRDFLIKLFF